MRNGTILQFLEVNPNADRLSLLTQCALGLSYLHNHEPALIHGDIKGENILIDDYEQARLSDFGLITISETRLFNTTHRPGEGSGTIMWMAPELFKGGALRSRTSDVYAFGMTIVEVYMGKPPLSSGNFTNEGQVLLAIVNGFRPKRIEVTTSGCTLPDELWNMATCCWDQDPKHRPDIDAIVEKLDSLLQSL